VEVTKFAQTKNSAASPLQFQDLISLFDVDGIVHREFVSPGQRANQKFFLNVLKILREKLQRNNPEKWQSGDWFLHHDNAPAYTTLNVQQFLAKNKMMMVSHHPHSPDLAPCPFFFYTRMKQVLKWQHFADVAEIQRESVVALGSISVEDFRQYFQQWENCRDRCIQSQGQYFEGD